MNDDREELQDGDTGLLLAALRSAATGTELARHDEIVSAMMRVARDGAVGSIAPGQRERRVRSKRAVRVAIGIAVLLGGTSAAAATGNLPDAAQSATARFADHFGPHLVDPGQSTSPSDGDPGDGADESTTTSSSAVTSTSTTTTSASTAPSTTELLGVAPATTADRAPGPDVTGPAKAGLCRAWANHGAGIPANEHATSMRRLQEAATAAGMTVEQFCADETTTPVSPTTATTVDGNGSVNGNGNGNGGNNSNNGNNGNNGNGPSNGNGSGKPTP